MSGRLFGVGVGPGDPELITLRAARLIGAADVIAYHAGRGRQSHARRIAADLIPDGVVEEQLTYPVTTGVTDHPGGYAGAMAAFYEDAAGRLAAHLEAGLDVVLLAEGDPLFYGSFMYMHDRLADRFQTEIVPGVPAFLAGTAEVASPLVRQTDVLTVLPGTLPEPELARRLADTDGAIVMKLGRTFPAVRRALHAAGRLDDALYVERASMPEQQSRPVAEVDADAVPYFSLIVVPGDSRNGQRTRAVDESVAGPGVESTTAAPAAGDSHSGGQNLPLRRTEPATSADRTSHFGEQNPPLRRTEPATSADRTSHFGEQNLPPRRTEPPTSADRTSHFGEQNLPLRRAEVVVVGIGPGPQQWVTPEVRTTLDEVDHIVGYGPYLDRVSQRPGLTRHASGNTVEVDRARQALELALAGERVAVVSGGDAGIFGMAAAVYEAAEEPRFAEVGIRVLPGLSAVQAVAARAGAPIGADFAVLSLSDWLKPWEVVERRLRAVSAADLVLAIYNPASRSRTEQIGRAREVLLEHRTPDTVVVVGRDVGRPGERVTVETLAGLDPATIDMRCLLIIGATGTRVSPAGVWTPRYVR